MQVSIAVRAVFSETENAELNKVLNSIQQNIILPAYLPEKQRRIVFDPQKRSYLEQNPIVIEVDGLEHKFSSIDRFNGIEESKMVLNRALDRMHSAGDWANLGTLLAGYKKAGIQLKAKHRGRIARMAGIRGHIHTIIECAKQSDRTGLSLKYPEVTARIFASINSKVYENRGDAAEAKQALRWTETVLDLLQRPEHTDSTRQTRDRLHYSRPIRGMTLFSRACAVQAGSSSDRELELLRDEVSLFVSLWQDSLDEDLSDLHDFACLNPELERHPTKNRSPFVSALNGNGYVQVLCQNIKGIEVAMELVKDNTESLVPIRKKLGSHLQEFAINSEARKVSWAEEYEKVMGEQPDWQPMSGTTASVSVEERS